jgi:NAD+ kinase
MKAGIVSRTDEPNAILVTKRILDFLEGNEINVLVETDTALKLNISKHFNLSELTADFIITVGGDGTILRTAMEMKNPETPILGVNMGRRGFLSEVTIPEVEEAIKKILNKKYQIESTMKLSSKHVKDNQLFPDSLNEVLVTSNLPSKMLVMGLYVDDQHVMDIQADGAIVATPAGSTAYNMSAGGSIVSPEVNAISFTAICPYSYFKSLIIPNKSKIRIDLLKPRTEGLVIIDGRSYHDMEPLSSIECWISEYRAHFIRFNSFYSRVNKRIKAFQTQ